MPEPPVHLMDVNVLAALLDEAHVHSKAVEAWFDTPGLQWALCAFTEAGVLRYFTRPKTGDLSMEQVTAMLERLRQQAGYHYQPITADWHTLTKRFAKRVHGHNQVTDAYLLGIALGADLILVTFDKAILHLPVSTRDMYLCWRRKDSGRTHVSEARHGAPGTESVWLVKRKTLLYVFGHFTQRVIRP